MKFGVIAALTALTLGACSSSLPSVGERPFKAPPLAWPLPLTFECHAMTAPQIERARVSLAIFRAFKPFDPVYRGAADWLSQEQEIGEAEPHCLPVALLKDATQATVETGEWDKQQLDIVPLRLARQLGPRNPKIIAYVARVAFAPAPLTDDIFSDIRPEARATLASFGSASRPWLETASHLMNSDTVLGTSAAQVAASSSDPKAVEAVAQLLRRQLEASSGVIPRERAQRVVELVYALGAAGEAARSYVPLLKETLGRQVQSLAPPFGVIERQPNEVCRALKSIGGDEAEAILATEQCKPPWSMSPG